MCMFGNFAAFMQILNWWNVHKNHKFSYTKYLQIWWENMVHMENRALLVEKMFSL